MIRSADAERHLAIKITFFSSQCYARYIARDIACVTCSTPWIKAYLTCLIYSSHCRTNEHEQHISGTRGSNQADSLLAVIRLGRSTQLNQVSSFLVERHEAIDFQINWYVVSRPWWCLSVVYSLLDSTISVIYRSHLTRFMPLAYISDYGYTYNVRGESIRYKYTNISRHRQLRMHEHNSK